MIKKFYLVLKKIVIGAFVLYGYNLIAAPINLMIPINICTVGILTVFGILAIFPLIIILVLIY